MNGLTVNWILAFSGGILLTLMIDFNSQMAEYTSPVFASWIAHGIGSISSFIIFNIIHRLLKKNSDVEIKNTIRKSSLWTYLGGIPGAMAVILAAITVNSELGLAGALALMLVGQVIFGVISDHFGLFGSLKRSIAFTDFVVVGCVLVGSWLIILFRA